MGEERTNQTSGETFLAIRREHFELIRTAHDLSKLYTHRLPSVKKIASLAPERP